MSRRCNRTLLLIALVALGCSRSPPPKSDADHKAEVTRVMHDVISAELEAWRAATLELQTAAPAPKGRGWDPVADAAAIASMKDAWRRSRLAYEHVEGAVAPLFPDRDFATDARYDDYLVELRGKGDPDPFDGKGVTGMHGIERILYAKEIPPSVVIFERSLPGYSPAAYPSTESEALAFKTELVQKLLDDIDAIIGQWRPTNIDLGTAFVGLVALVNEQREKVVKAATGEEESRYANMTLFDLRNNLEGTAKAYEAFRPWILSKPSGAALDADIRSGFEELRATYSKHPGDAMPPPPPTWSSDKPTREDLSTPFGQLFTTVRSAVDPARKGSMVSQMNDVADLLGFPEFKAER